MKSLQPIVEGHGDAAAVPLLLRRMLQGRGVFDVQILRPHQRGDLPKFRGRISDFLKAAAFERAPIIGVFDYDCATCLDAVRDTENLIKESQSLALGVPVRFALIEKEFESLFLFDETTTRNVLRFIDEDVVFPTNPEQLRNAKGWLSSSMPSGVAYKETTHQAKIAAQLDVELLARKSPSFMRLDAALSELLSEMAGSCS